MECLVKSVSKSTLNTFAECIRPLEVLKSLDNNHPLHIHAIIDESKGIGRSAELWHKKKVDAH